MTIVAISRELGSGGTAIAAAVAKAVNFEYVDREIILQAARVHEVPEEKIADVDERRLSLWERFDEEKRRYLTFIESAYYAFAEKGNLVTAGRGGPFFLRDVSHALKVRIMAPFEVRVKRVMEQEKVDQRTATARARHYDLVVNTGAEVWQFSTDLLVWAARHPQYQPTPESRQRIRDLSLAAQVRAAIAKDPVTRNINVEVTTQVGRVALKGVVFIPAMMD